LIRFPKGDAADWQSRFELVAAALVQSRYKTDITVWANLRRIIGGDSGLCLYVTPYKDHYYAKLRERMRQIPGCDQDEYGRRENVPVEEARPVFGVSKNRLERYLTPVWWRDEVYATVRAGWAARGDVPEEVDYQLKFL
jgi:hypothetical protein